MSQTVNSFTSMTPQGNWYPFSEKELHLTFCPRETRETLQIPYIYVKRKLKKFFFFVFHFEQHLVLPWELCRHRWQLIPIYNWRKTNFKRYQYIVIIGMELLQPLKLKDTSRKMKNFLLIMDMIFIHPQYGIGTYSDNMSKTNLQRWI